MQKGQKYELISFNGTTEPSQDCEAHENYWALIGQKGTLIHFADELNFSNKNRVLIQFEQSIEAQGLICHNTVANSLWILKTDLDA